MSVTTDEARERGRHDGERNRLLVESGMYGPYPRNRYASNPYPTNSLLYTAYNEGRNEVGVYA